MVCTVLLNHFFCVSLIITASRIGAGKEKSSCSMLNTMVFVMILPAYTSVKNASKCFSPTHGLPSMRNLGMKSLKAMVAPYMG